MFIAYILHKKSWIGIVGLLMLLTNALILLDAGIHVEAASMIYLNGLFLIVFGVFFIFRYKKETSYYKSLLQTKLGDDWFEAIPTPKSRFPDHTMYMFLQSIYEFEQSKRRDDYSSQQKDHNDLVSWVHEIKTPLTAMKITLDAHASNEVAQKLNAPWLRMHLLIDRQLYMSRLAHIDTDLLPERQAIQHLLKEEIRVLSTWCMEKNISIDLTGSPDAAVYTDKKWCGFVIRQLLTNAIKYSPLGGTVFIHVEHDEHNSANVTIQDEGPGIPAYDLPRVFDKGFTGENGRLQHSATGMGLYLAKEISEKLHIRLQLSSDVGEGTSVMLRFSHANPFERVRRSLL